MSEQLRAVHLHGALKQFSEEPIELAVNDVRDVISGLNSRFSGFKKHLLDNPNNVIVLTDNNENPRPVYPEFINVPFDTATDVHLFPATEGAGIELAAIILLETGMAGVMTAATLASIMVNVAVSIVLGLVSSMLSPQTPNSGSERPASKPSFLYNGPENVMEQGYQVPIVYGSHMTGSVVVSAGITVEQLAVASTQATAPAGDASPAQPASPAPLDWQWTGEGAGP